jgi:DNA repair protein RadC
MSLDPSRALGLDLPHPTTVYTAHDALRWAHSVPDFGFEAEAFALFLDDDHLLQRAVWLGPHVDLDELAGWPRHLAGFAPWWATAGVIILICRPGDGAEPSLDDDELWHILRTAHEAQGVPILDVVLVDGNDWQSLAATLR